MSRENRTFCRGNYNYESKNFISLDKYTQWVYFSFEVIRLEIREMRKLLGYTQGEFAVRYNIPFRTVQNWENDLRKPPEYFLSLLGEKVRDDLLNKKTARLPRYNPRKLDLPKRSDFIGSTAWLKAVRDCIGEPVIFALDEALMCQGNFSGRSDEYLVWVYGSDTATRFNGVIVIGNQISKYCVENRNGLYYTNFNRTLSDALANESILDMQGITEAVSRYYSSNNNSFEGLFVPPKYQEQFEKLAEEAKEYYSS